MGRSKAECLDDLGRRYGRAVAARDLKPVEVAARDAHRPGGLSVDALVARIRFERTDEQGAAA